MQPDQHDGPDVLRRSLIGAAQDARACVQAFAPMVFALAQEFSLKDPEQAVAQVFRDIQALCATCERSRLSPQAWVAGVARRRFRLIAEAEQASVSVVSRRPAPSAGPFWVKWLLTGSVNEPR